MIFLERKHHCPNCNKEVFLFRLITTKKSITTTQKCPVCSTDLISYWFEYPKKYINTILISMPFFFFPVLYALWRNYQSIISAVDVFIVISNFLAGGFILVFSSLYKKKPTPPTESDNSVEKLKLFKRQFVDVLFLNIIGFVIVSGLNGLIWLIITMIAKIA
ncbi:MAG: hypothetical protein ACTSQE_11115 [Candidatus Heimdallarchaeaceae archaeon]